MNCFPTATISQILERSAMELDFGNCNQSSFRYTHRRKINFQKTIYYCFSVCHFLTRLSKVLL